MKKTWIKIKRGLLRPEHREKLGIKVWLYMYMLDRVDWETGTIFGWKDKDEADDIGMPWRTLQKQRQEIEELGYITCIKQQYSQDIVVHKWTNPREYTGEEYNPHTQTSVLSKSDDDQSTHQSTHQVVSKLGTPTYNPQITNHIEEDNNIGVYTELSVVFCNKTQIPEFSPSPRRWFEALTKMGEAGVEPCDIESAVDILRDRDYSIVGLSSVTNTAISEMSKRIGKKPDLDSEEARSRYVSGEYADFIEH